MNIDLVSGEIILLIWNYFFAKVQEVEHGDYGYTLKYDILPSHLMDEILKHHKKSFLDTLFSEKTTVRKMLYLY